MKTNLEPSMAGGYHSFVPLCSLLGKQGFFLAVKRSPLVLLWQLCFCLHCNEAAIHGWCSDIVLPLARKKRALG